MFQTRFSFSLSRFFGFRRRGAANPNDRAQNAARAASTLYAPPPPPLESRRPLSLQPEAMSTTSTTSSTGRPRPTLVSSPLLSPIAQSPPTSPDVIPRTNTPLPIIIIGEYSPQSTLPLPPAPAPSGGVGPQIPVDGVSLLDSPTVPNPRRVSFQLPPEDRPSTPLSTCSTLVPEVGSQAEGESPQPPSPGLSPEHSPVFETADSEAFEAVLTGEDESIAELPVAPSQSGRDRHMSMFAPRPLRMDANRFSLPVVATIPAGTNTRDGGAEYRRMTLIPSASGLSSAKKDKRASRWDREMSKPETQEVLRALREI